MTARRDAARTGPDRTSRSRRSILKATGTVGATLALGGVGAADCGASRTRSLTDSLAAPGDSDCLWLSFSESPCYVEIRLDAADPDVDFDLYANADASECPTVLSHEYAADTPNGEARIVIDDPDPSMDSLAVLVFAEFGSGDYTLTYEFHGP